MNRDKIIVVSWVDASSDGRWIDKEESAERVIQINISVGFLLTETDAYIKIVQTFSDIDIVNNTLTIPKGLIRNLKSIDFGYHYEGEENE